MESIKIYVERRDKFIEDFLANIQIEYRKSEFLREFLDRAIELTCLLQVGECTQQNLDFVNDLNGMFAYAAMNTRMTRANALTTAFHDLGEWVENRNEPWFSPRSEGYRKFLSGATNVIP